MPSFKLTSLKTFSPNKVTFWGTWDWHFNVIYIYIFFFFLGLNLHHMENPQPWVELELYLRPIPQPWQHHIWAASANYPAALWKCWILNPLSETRDWILILTESMLGPQHTEQQWELQNEFLRGTIQPITER